MPGKHNENTKLLGFYAKRDLLALVDETRAGKGRSQFMREAAIEYMEARDVVVPPELKDAPDRVGKGGRTKYPPLNVSNSKLISEAKAISEKAEAAGAHQIPKSRRSRAARAPSGNTGRPSGDVSRGSKDRPFPPTQAPT